MAEPIQFPEEIVQNEDRIEQPMQQQVFNSYRLNSKMFNSHRLNSSNVNRRCQLLATWTYVAAFDLCANV
jgi:hypothetical protein